MVKPMKPTEHEVLQAVRSLVGDEIHTAPALARIFTLEQVERKLGVRRGTVRRSHGSRLRLAVAVRLAEMDRVLAELGRIGRGKIAPAKSFRRWCMRLTREDGLTLFQEGGWIAQRFRARLSDDLVRIAERGRRLGVFDISDLNGGALLVLDALSAIVLSEQARPYDIDEAEYERDDGETASLLASHIELLLRSWGGRDPDAKEAK